jgi:hypothetical protein
MNEVMSIWNDRVRLLFKTVDQFFAAVAGKLTVRGIRMNNLELRHRAERKKPVNLTGLTGGFSTCLY